MLQENLRWFDLAYVYASRSESDSLFWCLEGSRSSFPSCREKGPDYLNEVIGYGQFYEFRISDPLVFFSIFSFFGGRLVVVCG